jgi:hypothetical protein
MTHTLTLQKLTQVRHHLQNDLKIDPYAYKGGIVYVCRKYDINEGWVLLFGPECKYQPGNITEIMTKGNYRQFVPPMSTERFHNFWFYREARPDQKTFFLWLETYYEVQKTYAEGERKQSYNRFGGDSFFVKVYQDMVQEYERIITYLQANPDLSLTVLREFALVQKKDNEDTEIKRVYDGLFQVVDEYLVTMAPCSLDEKKEG